MQNSEIFIKYIKQSIEAFISNKMNLVIEEAKLKLEKEIREYIVRTTVDISKTIEVDFFNQRLTIQVNFGDLKK